MKYLKKFNESKQPTVVNVNDVQTIGDQCFAYLYDEGYVFNVWDDDDYEVIAMELAKENKDSLDDFIWKDVKDFYIPFLNVLRDKYDGLGHEYITFNKMADNADNISINNIVDDKYNSNDILYSISLSFWKYSNVKK